MSGPVLRRLPRLLWGLALALILLFCFLPPLVIFGLSFFRDVFTNFPPHEFTLDLYRQLGTEAKWRDSIIYTIRLALPAAILTVLMVAPAVLALERGRIRGRGILEFGALLPMLMPGTGYVVAIYILYLKLNWTQQYLPLVLIEAVVSSPIAFLIMRATMHRIPHSLDFVAMSLGASRMRALWDISASLLRPAMLAGAMFSVIHVFDDALYVVFLGGPTVSKTIYDSIEFTLTPVIAALSAAFTMMTTLLVLVAGRQRRRA